MPVPLDGWYTLWAILKPPLNFNKQQNRTQSQHIPRLIILLARSFLFHYYRPPTRLREGNVFSRVCHSVHRGGGGSPCDITHGALDLTVQPTGLGLSPLQTWDPPSPPPDMGPPRPWPPLVTSGDHHWRPGQTCSLDLTVQSPPPILISSGLHRSTYGWQAAGWHPTGMLSLYLLFFHSFITSNHRKTGMNVVALVNRF